MGKLNVFKLGTGGINLVKDPLHLSDDEVAQAQNAEIQSDVNVGGEGALTKRGGLAVLNSAALAGAVYGMVGIPILTTYTRTLYVARGTATSDTFATTTTGSNYTLSASALAWAVQTKWSDENADRDAHRGAAFKTFIIYPGNNYTKNTDNPEIAIWDSTTAQLVERIQIGPSGNGSPPYAITDMITANGKVYFGVHDPGGTGANIAGRVMVYDPITGSVTQVLAAFGPGTNEITGGAPSALAWYQGQLFVGLNGSLTTNGIGKIVRAYVDVDTTWTTDVSNLTSHIATLGVFKGDLFAGSMSSATTGASIYRRTSSTAAWTAVATDAGGAGGSGHYASLVVYNDEIYAAEYHSTTPIIHIVKSTDGTTWSTARDVDSLDGGVAGNLPGNSGTYGADLFFVFRSTTATATDGFVMRLSSGTWTKASTANYNGGLLTLVSRT